LKTVSEDDTNTLTITEDSEVKSAIANAKDSTQETALSLLQYLEKAYDCSGMCRTSLFYWGKTLSAGIPQETCLGYMKEEIGNNLTYMGIASLCAGIFLALVWVFQYALWCAKNK